MMSISKSTTSAEPMEFVAFTAKDSPLSLDGKTTFMLTPQTTKTKTNVTIGTQGELAQKGIRERESK